VAHPVLDEEALVDEALVEDEEVALEAEELVALEELLDVADEVDTVDALDVDPVEDVAAEVVAAEVVTAVVDVAWVLVVLAAPPVPLVAAPVGGGSFPAAHESAIAAPTNPRGAKRRLKRMLRECNTALLVSRAGIIPR
jgi:hypothetical protein